MTVWVEQPTDDGSAVWGCDTCTRGNWCWDHTTARLEARTHARTHGTNNIKTIGQRHGPQPSEERDNKIRKLRNQGHTIQRIADQVGLSTTGVIKALRRLRENA